MSLFQKQSLKFIKVNSSAVDDAHSLIANTSKFKQFRQTTSTIRVNNFIANLGITWHKNTVEKNLEETMEKVSKNGLF